jgi:CRISPR/Cas system-associated exonuclease Cas4 (RecB family)
MSIVINVEELKIRPSAIESFYGCAYQWGRTFLGGEHSGANARASIGTAIHSAAETGWKESIKSKDKVMNKTAMKDAAIESWKEQTHDGVMYTGGDNEASCVMEIMKGTDAFVEDIVPFSAIPDAVEMYFEVPIDNSFVKSIGGTLDYLAGKTIADLKTSKRKSGAEGHVIQQTAYKYLAEANGYPIDTNLIQQIVIKKDPEGAILTLEPNMDRFKYMVNTMLDTLDLVYKDVAPIETILRPNPKHIFCSEAYCAFWKTCPAIQGKMEPTKVITKVKL